ncbi:class I SAM-dependent DNA methyltransferase [Alicyclobacillus dauci]|uniref:Methyltransferase domain-containing protein n=1 Tax=Alicyclobacillus dauci TaxID=1475485 RepID=A0ABY6Z6L3_9BACL|nr:class I SAM-dependent methyltransferase [Alicyclobacillus dauci]WAH38521.1 methyltransferase domain-containing protein [Alicyclobacillus dauci]
MSTYESFASIYDIFMQDAPYDQWLQLLRSKFTLATMDVADIGCGTGMLTVPLSFDVSTCVGVDASEAMLAQAQDRAMEKRSRAQWVCEDMRSLLLPRKMDLIVSTCDVINYLQTETELRQTFASVYTALKPNGYFLFDTIGPKRIEALREGYWHQIEDDAVLLHETRVTDRQIVHEVHAFVLAGHGDLYERIEERHVQQYFHSEEVTKLLEETGFTLLDVLSDFKPGAIDRADRVIYLAKR